MINYRLICKILGLLLIIESLLFIAGIGVSLYYHDGMVPNFVKSALITLFAGAVFLSVGLKAENKEIKERNQQLRSTVNEYTQKNEVLSERMQLAEKLNLTGLTFTPLNKRGKTEKRIGRAKQLLVSFTIPQNNSTPVGEKTFYVRIVSPEGNVLGNGATFAFENGNVAYTAKKTIEYDQQETQLSIYYNVNTALSKGNYTVEVFVDDYRLVSRTFAQTK